MKFGVGILRVPEGFDVNRVPDDLIDEDNDTDDDYDEDSDEEEGMLKISSMINNTIFPIY